MCGATSKKKTIFLLANEEARDFDPPMPRCRTDYPAGSIQKIDVFRERLERGESLFHPDDQKAIATVEQQTQAKLIVQQRLKLDIDQCKGKNGRARWEVIKKITG